jgi:hypothetical protein
LREAEPTKTDPSLRFLARDDDPDRIVVFSRLPARAPSLRKRYIYFTAEVNCTEFMVLFMITSAVGRLRTRIVRGDQKANNLLALLSRCDVAFHRWTAVTSTLARIF